MKAPAGRRYRVGANSARRSLDLRHSPLHLGAREIPVPIIDRLELAAVNRNARFGEEAHRAAEHNKPAADLADGPAVVLRKSASYCDREQGVLSAT